MKKATLISLVCLVGIQSLAQVAESVVTTNENLVTGNVKDSNGVPLTGVHIMVKETPKETLTNFDGNFNLNVKEGDILIFSGLGFNSKEVTMSNQMTMHMVLEEEGKSETTKALTKSDMRKMKKALKKAKREAEMRAMDYDLGEDLLKAAGRTAKSAIKKNSEN